MIDKLIIEVDSLKEIIKNLEFKFNNLKLQSNVLTLLFSFNRF